MSQEVILPLIQTYKERLAKVGLTDEVYKWKLLEEFKGRPRPDAPDLLEEIKSIDFSNLIYANGISVLRKLAEHQTEALRACLLHLFDEALPLQDRLLAYHDKTLELYRAIEPNEKLSHHQDERTMATLLSYHNPQGYALYKFSFYKKYCELLGINTAKKNYKYTHYLELLYDLINTYLYPDQDLQSQVQSHLPPGIQAGEHMHLLAQDILYTVLELKTDSSRQYWRLGTTDGPTSHWNAMKKNGVVSIGWKETGDLRQKSIKEKRDIAALLEKAGYYQDAPKNLSSRIAGEVYNFFTHIQAGDVILAQEGTKIHGLGIVSGPYSYDPSMEFAHQIPVNWKVLEPDFKNNQGLRSTVREITDKKLILMIDQHLQASSGEKNATLKAESLSTSPLNQILYGPPGTGKTYATKALAVQIITGRVPPNRQSLLESYEDWFNKGNIQFVTFHQSTSYEDFVEGIKPTLQKEEEDNPIRQIGYKIEDGIFKKMCVNAAFEYQAFVDNKSTTPDTPSFGQRYDAFFDQCQQLLDEQVDIRIPLKSGHEVKIIGLTDRGNFVLQHLDGLRSYTVSRNLLEKLYNAIDDFEQISNIYSYFRSIIGGNNASAYWAILNQIFLQEPPANLPAESPGPDYEQKRFAFDNINWSRIESNDQVPNYVLIIDEINRGNVASILGELITLIEVDKRAGSKEAIRLCLPYSQTQLAVPPNLYLIGTMNTADRSVEALDTALRRRFSFTEMPPQPSLIATQGALRQTSGILSLGDTEIDLARLLSTINTRIEILLDRDHLIGHSYFMSVQDEQGLRQALAKSILPLLQEYFYGDYGKIALVLGEGFCQKKKTNTQQLARVANYDTSFLSDKSIYEIANVMASEFHLVAAIKTLLQDEAAR